MGAGVSRRYKYDITPHRYFERHALPKVRNILQCLEISEQDAFQLFRSFIKIDLDASGEISMKEYYRFLRVKKTAFTERVFGLFDEDQSDVVSFEEFVVGVWRFCTYDSTMIARLSFDIFDIDSLGTLLMEECDALLRMVHNQKHADSSLLELIKTESENGKITFDSFAKLIDCQPHILQPAFDLQRILREKLLGVEYWERATIKRRNKYGSTDCIDTILSSPKNTHEQDDVPRLENSEDGIVQKSSSKELLNVEEQIHKEQKTNETPDDDMFKLPEERREGKLNKKLNKMISKVERDYTIEEVHERRENREKMWELFDETIAASKSSLQAQKERDLAAVSSEMEKVNNNAQQHTSTSDKKDKRSTKNGKAARHVFFRFLATRRENKYDPAFKMEEEIRAIEEKYDELFISLDEKWNEYTQDLVRRFGTQTTNWERLIQTRGGEIRPLWYNTNTGERLESERDPAICESCDAFIECVDYKCFECGAMRSEINSKKYKGRIPLQEVEKMQEKHMKKRSK